jgi:hypothetical protein
LFFCINACYCVVVPLFLLMMADNTVHSYLCILSLLILTCFVMQVFPCTMILGYHIKTTILLILKIHFLSSLSNIGNIVSYVYIWYKLLMQLVVNILTMFDLILLRFATRSNYSIVWWRRWKERLGSTVSIVPSVKVI